MRICDRHEYQVPLIDTMSFNGAEFWCPYCGATMGMFGVGEDVDNTEELEGRYSIYEEHSAAFLRATGTLICASFELNKVRIKPFEMPENMKKELRELAKSWKYKIPAVELLMQGVPDFEYPNFSCSYCKFNRVGSGKRCKDVHKMDISICDKWQREEK